MRGKQLYLSDGLRVCMSESDISSLVNSTRYRMCQLRVPLAKYREWRTSGYSRQGLGQLKVLRGLYKCFRGSRLVSIGRASYGLAYGEYLITLNRYELLVMRGSDVWFGGCSDNKAVFWLLPYVLGIGNYDYDEEGNIFMC